MRCYHRARLQFGNDKATTVVPQGVQDMLLPNELSKEIAAGISGATLTIIPECGHMSQPERPQAVADALSEWLAAR